MKRLLIVIVVLIHAAAAAAQQRTGVSAGTSLPSSCADGDLFVKTAAPKGLHQCIDGAWSKVDTGGSSGGAHAAQHVTGGNDVIANAVAGGNAGLLSGTDKTKLDGIASGAEVNVNADWSASSGDAQILNKPALPTLLRVAANVANSTTTFANVTGLTLSVTSGQTYQFQCWLSYTTAATTTAMQLSVNGPSMTALDYEIWISTTATAAHYSAQTAVDTVVNPATGGGATRLPARVSGSFIPSANGTFAIRSRSEVNSSAATIMRGGWCAVY